MRANATVLDRKKKKAPDSSEKQKLEEPKVYVWRAGSLYGFFNHKTPAGPERGLAVFETTFGAVRFRAQLPSHNNGVPVEWRMERMTLEEALHVARSKFYAGIKFVFIMDAVPNMVKLVV